MIHFIIVTVISFTKDCKPPTLSICLDVRDNIAGKKSTIFLRNKFFVLFFNVFKEVFFTLDNSIK